MSGSGREALPVGRQGSKGRAVSEDPPGGSGGVMKPFRWAGRHRESIPEVLEGSICPPKWPAGVGRPFR